LPPIRASLGVAGLVLAVRERGERKSRHASVDHMFSASNQSLHGRLKTDSGEEVEVYLQRAGQ